MLGSQLLITYVLQITSEPSHRYFVGGADYLVILAVTVKWDSLQEHWEVSVHALLVIEITINGLLQITLSHSRVKVAKNMALTLLNRIFYKYTKYIVLCNIVGQNLYLFQIR